MRVRYLRRMERIVDYGPPVVTEFFDAGYEFEGDRRAYLLVLNGVAEPADEECRKRVNLIPGWGCQICQGTGSVNARECPICKGTGNDDERFRANLTAAVGAQERFAAGLQKEDAPEDLDFLDEDDE